MKLKKDFALRQVADTWVVLPLGSATADFNGMLTMNETGALLWKTLEMSDDSKVLVEALTSEYTVAVEQAQNDVEEFLSKLKKVGCLEE